MCTYCNFVVWLLEFKEELAKYGVKIDGHEMWLDRVPKEELMIEWRMHPNDGLRRVGTLPDGRRQYEQIPIEKIYYAGSPYRIEVHPTGGGVLTIDYPAYDGSRDGPAYPYRVSGVITINLSDLSLGYWIERSGVAQELSGPDELPEPIKFKAEPRTS